MNPTTIAAIQMVSTPSLEENIVTARSLIAQAAEQGAQLVLLPEYWAGMGRDLMDYAEVLHNGPIQRFMSDMARQHQLWLIGGTLPLSSPEVGKVFNATLVYNPDGLLAYRYDKMHLFSFANPAKNESYDESRNIIAGAQIGSFEAPFGKVGLSVCYDLRFPELYRAMGTCALIVVPAAFTYTTGIAHWEVLLRTRAIENQCYVLAAAQGGQHQNGRHTWGHSMLIDPWGQVKAVLPEGIGLVSGVIDQSYLDSVRTNLPALQHRRL